MILCRDTYCLAQITRIANFRHSMLMNGDIKQINMAVAKKSKLIPASNIKEANMIHCLLCISKLKYNNKGDTLPPIYMN